MERIKELPALLRMQDGRPVWQEEDESLSLAGWNERRGELLSVLAEQVYGRTDVSGQPDFVVESTESTFGGKADWLHVRATVHMPKGDFSFPFALLVPRKNRPAPAFVSIGFDSAVPYKYLPAEEVIDHGFAIAHFGYKDVTDDSAEIDGLAAVTHIDPANGWGKIGMWAHAASTIMDYLQQRGDLIDGKRVCVAGHSRLGKTALWCGAQDERFSMVVSNDSGCSGAAISRGKVGESIDDITRRFPYWFCGNYKSWANREFEAPFDQHFLLALIAPRKLYVTSATEDEWADPRSEYACCLAVSPVWKMLGETGLVGPDDALPAPDEPLHEGGVGYHLRTGEHFFSRTDWLHIMAYREKHHV